MTASAPHAYAIADAFRARNIPVVMGGIHPTVMPDEAARHADAVIIGEAEPVWSQVIEDLAANRLKPHYGTLGVYADLTNLPRPRYELLQKRRYLTTNVVQTARGCPNACAFCTVSTVYGRRYRFRPVEEVVEELRPLGGWVGFVDDNITGHPRRAKELFEALIQMQEEKKVKLRWVGQGDLNLAKDPELMNLAVRSGCHALFMGLESLSQENLRATHKMPNVGTDMSAAIKTIHHAGLEIIGSFVLGLDGDYPGTAARIADFAARHKLAAAQFSVLTPFPGTETWKQLEDEKRITDYDWSHYSMSHVVYRPLHMTEAELFQEKRYAYDRFYSIPSILKRCFTTRGKLKTRLLVNLSYRGLNHGGGLVGGLPTSQ